MSFRGAVGLFPGLQAHRASCAAAQLAAFGVLFLVVLSSPVHAIQQAEESTTDRVVEPDFTTEWPFAVGEELQYDVTWGPVTVGRAAFRVEALETLRGVPTFRLAMELKGGIPLYRIDDRTVSWLAVEPYRSLRFEQVLRQGGYRRHRRWELDHETLTRAREDWDEEIEEYRPNPRQKDIPIPFGALDEVDYLFLVRTLPLTVGHTYRFERYFEDDGNPVIIQVLRRERVRVRAGTFETIVVRPIIQTDGMFSEDGEAEVYISDDESRLIVQLKTKMATGTINMFLREYDPGGDPPS